MKLVFVASPFRATTDWERWRNVHRAQELALEVWKAGAVAVCPQANSAHFHESLPDSRFLDGYLALLARCDAVLVGGQSAGVAAEMVHADECGLPVFLTIDELSAWIERQEAPLFADG